MKLEITFEGVRSQGVQVIFRILKISKFKVKTNKQTKEVNLEAVDFLVATFQHIAEIHLYPLAINISYVLTLNF